MVCRRRTKKAARAKNFWPRVVQHSPPRSGRSCVYRYEDVILNKRPWLASMAEHLGWRADMPGLVEGMMGWADKVPAEERSHEFIRRVIPGDHREKLSPAVIAALDASLRPAMELFGYS